MRLPSRAIGLALLAAVAITCTDAPTGPASVAQGGLVPGRVSLAATFSPEAAKIYGKLASAGFVVTEVRVRLIASDGTVFHDSVIPFPVSQNELVIEIPVTLKGTDQKFSAVVELRNDEHQVFFAGSQGVTGRATNLPPLPPPFVEVEYTGPGKDAKTLTLSPPDTTVVGSGGNIPFTARGTDASGKPVADLLVSWSVSDATLASIAAGSNVSATLTGLGKRGVATVSAVTPLGVVGTSKVTFVPPATKIVAISGGGQSGVAGSALPQPFVVEVQAADNLPVPGAKVAFRAATAGGTVVVADAIADNAGRASTSMTLGTAAGIYQFEASTGLLAPVTISATATAAPASLLAKVSGDAQTDSVGRTLPLPLVVKVTDQFGGGVTGATVTWTRLSGSGTLSATSTATGAGGVASVGYTLGNTPGSDTVRASVAGIGSVLFTMKTVNRTPASIAIVAGAGQSGAPNALLPAALTVRVRDAQNNPVQGETVTWSAAGAFVTFTTPASLTDALGQASTTVKLGQAAGTTTVTATAGPVSTTTQLTIMAGAGASITKTAGDLQSATAGTNVEVAPSVTVRDAFNNPVANAGVVFAVVSGGGSVTGGTTTTNASGVATVGSWKLGNTAGANSLSATSGGLTTTFTATGTTGAPARILLPNPVPASITVGQSFTFVPAQLADANNNPVPLAGVVITATGNVQPSNTTFVLTATTDANGIASFQPLPYAGAIGTLTFTLTAPGASSLTTSPIAVLAGPAAKLILSTQPAPTTASGAPLSPQPAVQLTDIGNNPVGGAGVDVVAAITSGGGTLGGTTTVATNANGLATYTDLAVSGVVGPRTISFSSGNLTPVTVSVTVGAGSSAQLVANSTLTQTTQAGTAVGAPPSVKVTDAFGNPVAGVAVDFTVQSAGNTISNGATTTGTTLSIATNALGIAQLTSWTVSPTAGTNTVSVSSAAIPAQPFFVFTATGTAGAAAKLSIATQPSSPVQSGSAFTTQPAVQLADANGNPVSQQGVSITASVASGSATLGGSTTAVTDATGKATFANLAPSGLAGTITLSFTAASLTGVTSGAIQITAGAPSALDLQGWTVSGATSAGTALTPQPAVRLADASGNTVALAGVVVTATIATSPAGGTPVLSNATATTSALGIATFSGLAIGGPAGNYTLTFSASGYTPATSGSIAIGAAQAAQIAIVGGNGQSGTVGSTLPLPLAVKVSDIFGNAVAGYVVFFDAANSGGAQLSDGSSTASSLGVSTNASGIAQVQLTLGPTAQSYSVFASADLANGTVTFTETATAASPSKLVAVAGQGFPTSVTVGGAFAPIAVRLTDANNNPVTLAGVPVTLSGLASPSGISFTLTSNTDGSGIATFAPSPYIGAAGSATFTATSPGYTSLTGGPVPIVAGAAAKLLIAQQPAATAASGAVLPTQPVVRVADAGDNLLSVQGTVITAAIASGGGTLGGTTTLSSNAGQVSYTNLSITGTPGVRTLSFGSTGLTSAVSNGITISAGAASTIAAQSVTSQSGTAGQAVSTPPAVIVTDASGTPVAGVVVTFTATNTGATVTNATTTGTSVTVATNGSGVAQLTAWTLSPTAGPNGLTAAASVPNGSPVTFSATGTAGSAAKMALTQSLPASITVGQPFGTTIPVQLQDASGNSVAQGGVTVTATGTVQPGSIAAYSLTAVTNASGVATFSPSSYTGLVGTLTFVMTAPGLTSLTTPSINVLTGSASKLVMATQPAATAASGVVLSPQPAVQVTDVGSNPVNIGTVLPITAAISSGGGTLSGTTSVNVNASGLATFTNLAITGTAGPRVLQFSGGGLTSVLSNTITLSAGAAAAITKVAGDAQTATVGTAVATAPSVSVTDGGGNPVAGASITFAATSGGGSVGGGTATTNGSGIATVGSWTLGTTAGANTLSASIAGGPSVTFTATGTAGAVAAHSMAVAPPATAASGVALTTQPQIQLKDAFGNNVAQAGVVITAAATGGRTVTGNTATTNAGGLATFSTLTVSGLAGAFQLTFASAVAPTLTSGSITLSAGAAASMSKSAGDAQSATAGTAVAVAPQVLITDAAGNPVSGVSVTFAIASGGGSVTGATSATNASGLATVGSWTLGTLAGANSLTATAGSLTQTFTATATTGAVAAHAFTVQPPATAASGVALTTQPQIQLKDAFGNNVAQAGVVITAAATGGRTVTGNTATTNAGGLATFTTLTVSGTTGTFQLTFSSSAAPTLTSASMTLTAGVAATMTKNAGDAQTATAGTAVAVAPSVLVRDASSNPVAGVSVTFAVASGNGSVTGATATTNASGIATVGSWTLGAVAGANSLTAAATGLTTQTFTATGVAAGATKMALTQSLPASITVGQAFPTTIPVQLLDANNNPVAQSGVTITATGTVQPSNTTPYSLTATTNASGIATFSPPTYTGFVGTLTFAMTASGLTTLTTPSINVLTGSASKLVVATQPAATAASGVVLSPQPTVQVTDVGSNPVNISTVLTITATISSGGGTLSGTTGVNVNSSGLATYTNLAISGTAGARVLQFSGGGLTPALSNTITLTAGPAASITKVAGDAQTATAGTAVATAPSVSVKDAAGNPVAGASVTFAVVTGGGSVTGGTTTTNSSGIATVGSWTLGTTAGANSLTATSGAFTATFTATGTAGAAASMIKNAGDGQTATAGTAVAVAPQVLVRDANLNPVSGVSVTFAVTAGGGSVVGGSATTNASGLATVTSWTLGAVAGSNSLTATASGLTTQTFTATGTGSPVLSTKTGSTVFVVPVGTTAPVQPVYQLRTAAGAPMTGQTVNLTMSGRCRFTGNTTSTSLTTDVNGEVQTTLVLPTASIGAGCQVNATAAAVTSTKDSTLVAVYPSGSTHAWVGTTSTAWSTATNWFTIAVGGPAVPGASQDAFIPYYNAFMRLPTLQATTSIRKIAMDSSAQIVMNSFNLDVGSGGVTGWGYLFGGTTHLTTTASLRGAFETVNIGQSGSCGAAAPMTGTIEHSSIVTLNIYCRTNIDTVVATQDVTVNANSGQGLLFLLSSNAFLGLSGNFNMLGDGLTVTGGQMSAVNAVLAGTQVTFNGGSIATSGTAAFRSASATYSSATLQIGGNATFGGTGAGQHNLIGGLLNVSGNLTQLTGTVASVSAIRRTFNTSSDHVTYFSGGASQTVSITDDSTSRFSIIRVGKTAGTPAIITGRAAVFNGTTQPRVQVLTGRLEVATGANFNISGGMTLAASTNLNILGAVVQSGSCTSASGATVTGSGTYNGGPVSLAICPGP